LKAHQLKTINGNATVRCKSLDKTFLSMIQECQTVNNYINEDVINCFFAAVMQQFPQLHIQRTNFHAQIVNFHSWEDYVQKSARRAYGNYDKLLQTLQDRQKVVIMPIGFGREHWAVLVRKFKGGHWSLWFIDSMSEGAKKRFQTVKRLYNNTPLTDTLPAIQWIEAPIVEQFETECGARCCVGALMYALSEKKIRKSVDRLNKVPELNMVSRLMVADVCKKGAFTMPSWLDKVVGISKCIK
jgi:hypothetical protein